MSFRGGDHRSDRSGRLRWFFAAAAAGLAVMGVAVAHDDPHATDPSRSWIAQQVQSVPALHDEPTEWPIAGPGGRDSDGNVLLVNTEAAGPVIQRYAGLTGGLDAEGNAREFVFWQHIDELREAGAIRAVSPDDPVLDKYCDVSATATGDCGWD